MKRSKEIKTQLIIRSSYNNRVSLSLVQINSPRPNMSGLRCASGVSCRKKSKTQPQGHSASGLALSDQASSHGTLGVEEGGEGRSDAFSAPEGSRGHLVSSGLKETRTGRRKAAAFSFN